jgi:hypothetical protein
MTLSTGIDYQLNIENLTAERLPHFSTYWLLLKIKYGNLMSYTSLLTSDYSPFIYYRRQQHTVSVINEK